MTCQVLHLRTVPVMNTTSFIVRCCFTRIKKNLQIQGCCRRASSARSSGRFVFVDRYLSRSESSMRLVLMFEGASTDKEEVAGISHSPHTYAVHPNGTNLRAGNGGSAMALLLGKRQNTRNIPIMVELRHLIADSQL
jgi:hypothetical protein